MTSIDGRRVHTRAELMAAYDLGLSTLEKWFRERAANGHPEPAGKVGSQLAWDAEAWDRWYAQREKAPAIPVGLVDREGLMELHGLSRHTAKKLWSERDTNGHPAPALTVGKALYWDRAEWAAWYDSYQSSPPDELVTLAEAARMLGLAQTSVTVYVKRPPAGWPQPAREEPLGGGRVRRFYRRSDILSFAAQRRG